MKNIKIVKNRSDIGAGTRGAGLGIDAMEIAAINAENNFFRVNPFLDVPIDNESIYNKVNTTNAKRIAFVEEHCKRVSKTVSKTILDGFFPIVLSGDHSSALGTISGVKAANPNAKLGVIWIDAHADLHSPFTSPSGNIHGMPLAAAMHNDNLNKQSNNPDKETVFHWNNLKKIGTEKPKFLPENLIFFGVRDTEAAENHLIESLQIKNFTVPEVRYKGLQNCLEEVIKKIDDCDEIYITFDVDSLDCDFVSKGTGTPVSFGFSPEEVKQIIAGFLKTNKVVCLEITEVNPLLDNKANKMAETAFDILDFVLQG